MSDLTLLFITAGERPKKWAKFHSETLAKLPYPMITLRDEKKMGYQRIYEQLLIGCKQATTPYVAVIEDDVLYPKEHFEFRPPLDTFAYNMNRLALIDYDRPTYSWRNRKSNCVLIAPRELAIEALEERFAKWKVIPKEWCGELGRARVDKWLGVTPRKSVEWFSTLSVVQVNHGDASEDRQKRNRKNHGFMRSYEIPLWGKADDILKLWQ